MHSKLSLFLMLSVFAVAFAAPSCPNGAQPFEGTGRAATESKARENANSDIARLFSNIKVDILDELTQKETSDGINEYANYQRKIKVEGGLYSAFVKDAEYPYPKENGQFVAKRYLCPNDAAKPYLDSLKIINQRVAIQKVNNSFCESLYKTYSPKVVFFERILERLGETAQVADYKKVEKECDGLRGSIRKGFVGFEEALDKVVSEISSKVRGRTNIKIVIAEIYASPQKTSNFIAAELENKLVKVKTFAVVEPVNTISSEQNFKMLGPMKYSEAMEIGKSSKANIVIVGSFDPYAGFSHFMIKALELPSTKTIAMHTDKVRPDDDVLSGLITTDKLTAITEDALAYFTRGEDLYRAGKYDEAIRELDRALAINGNLHLAYFLRGNIYDDKGNYDRAIEDYNAALRIKSDNHIALYNRGSAYDEKRNYDRAIEDYNAVLRIKPDFHKALINRGNAYYYKGNYDRAIEDWEAVLRIEPNNTEARKNLGIARQKIGSKTSLPTQPASVPSTPVTSSLIDTRDNRTYKVVKIGTQTWMAENLNYNAKGSKCNDDKEWNCKKYGRLYNWSTAKSACPKGWHLPSDEEWNVLMSAVGGKNTAGKYLKAKSSWNSNGNGQDKYGFSALPGGAGNEDGGFEIIGFYGYWWGSSEGSYDNSVAYHQYMSCNYAEAGHRYGSKSFLNSVRCLQD